MRRCKCQEKRHPDCVTEAQTNTSVFACNNGLIHGSVHVQAIFNI